MFRPITATVFVLMYKQPKSVEHSAVAVDFLRWALESGQPQARSLDYVPLPPGLVQQIEAYWKANFIGLAGEASVSRN
jgi:phosphate transport system substrate-binding protein